MITTVHRYIVYVKIMYIYTYVVKVFTSISMYKLSLILVTKVKMSHFWGGVEITRFVCAAAFH